MNLSEATSFVRARCAPDDDPCLTPDELLSCMDLARVEDANGLFPDDDDWTPTFTRRSCYRAVAEAWTIKRGKVVGRFDFTTDGQTFRRSQQLDHIEHQRALYARKVQSSPSTIGRT